MTLEAALLFLSLVWMGVLTLGVALVVRQLGLITLRLDISGQQTLRRDGPELGMRLPETFTERFPGSAEGITYLLLLSPTCVPCREIVPNLVAVRCSKPVIALVPGRDDIAQDLAAMLPSDYRVIRDPLATDVAMSLQMERTPSVIELTDGVATGRAFLFSAENFQELIDAAQKSPEHPELVLA